MEGGTGGSLLGAFGGWLLCLVAVVVQAADGEKALRGEYILRAAAPSRRRQPERPRR